MKKRAILMLTALAMAASMVACGDKKTDETAADSTEVAMTEAGTESTEAETGVRKYFRRECTAVS